MIKQWSFSKLTNFEQCKLRAKLLYVDKVPEPERPLKPGQTEQANDRGTRIHTAAEIFVQEPNTGLIPELKNFEAGLLELRQLYTEGKVIIEQEWAIDRDWVPCAWASDTAWCRAKLDVFVRMSPTEGRVIDYKTGRKFGNEIKHAEQIQLYQLLSFMRYPDLEKITVELWYIDQGPDETTRMTYTRDQGMRFWEKFNKRGLSVTDCTEFTPNPNKFSCKWCRYPESGHCTVGVK